MQRGIGRYSMALAQAMLRQGGRHDFRIVLNHHFPDSVAALRVAFDGLLPQEQIMVCDLPGPLAEYDQQNNWRIRAAEQLREHYLASLAPDVVHVASLFEGLSDDACGSVLHSRGQFDTAVTLYDLIPLMRKEKYLSEPHVANWYYRKLQSLKNAELLLAISSHSRQEALSALQLPEAGVVNISSAVDAIFRPRQLTLDAAQALRARYGLRRPFFMYTGGIDYRKNIEGLIEAYAMLPAALRQQYQLAVVCSIQDGDRQRLQKLAAGFKLAKDDLVLTGFVSDDDLVSLYNSTDLFVFPSLQEGFGLPALEAMSCGAPVIGSNNSSIPEVIGRADALFDPGNVKDIAAKMHSAITDAAFNASLRAHGLVQAGKFSWDASAQKTLAAFEQVHERRRQDGRVGRAGPARRPRLAYVSPLPPERSGIADYSAELLPELAKYYDIDVVLAQSALSDPWLAANFPQRSAAWFDAHASQFDRIVYHFGNSSFHSHMFGLLTRHPGVVVLHDFFLSGVVNHASAGSAQPNAYCQTLYEAHGYRALTDERDGGRDASLVHYPCNQAVLDQATGVIVHSAHSRELAECWYGPGRADDWRLIPLLRVLPGALDKAAARQRLGLADDDFLMCSFGLVALTKCNQKILEAWLNSALAQDARCHLVFVGENNIWKFGADLSRRMAGHGRIKITGFASQELYRTYLTAADAAVQLRTRSRGETSATILDCLAYRLPTIINCHGSAAEVPESAALKLADDFTEAELGSAMLRLRNDPQLAQQFSERAAAHMETAHRAAHIGALYRDAIEQFAQHSPRVRYAELLATLAAIDTTATPTEQDWLQAAACIAANNPGPAGRQLLIDVSDLTPDQDLAQWAMILQLIDAPPAGYRVEPVVRAEGRYRHARRLTLALIGRSDLVLDDAVADIKPGDCVLRMTAGAALSFDRALSNCGVAQAQLLFAPLSTRLELAPHLPAAAAGVLRVLEGLARELNCLHGPHTDGALAPGSLSDADAASDPTFLVVQTTTQTNIRDSLI